MVNVLIGNKNTDEIAILRQELTNDKIFRIENVVPLERKRCNTILTVPSNYIMRLTDLQKINTVLYKPISNHKLSNTIKKIAIDYNTPDIEVGEIEWLLLSLNFNCMSTRLYLYERCNYLLLL